MSISVILPNFNNAPYLKQCLDSFADDPAVAEIVIYDDGSTDDSLFVIEQAAPSKTRVIRGQGGAGATRARHLAIAEAHQPFLAFVDGDDYLGPGTLSACLKQALQDDLDMAIPAMMRVGPDENVVTPFVSAPEGVTSGEDALIFTIGRWRIAPGAGVTRRTVYEQVSECFEFHGYSDDELLSRHLLLASKRVGGAPGTYYYRAGERAPSHDQLLLRALTSIRALALAQSCRRQDWQATLRAARNQAVRTCFELARTMPKDLGKPLAQVVQELNGLDISWKGRDLLYRAIATGLRLRVAIRL